MSNEKSFPCCLTGQSRTEGRARTHGKCHTMAVMAGFILDYCLRILPLNPSPCLTEG